MTTDTAPPIARNTPAIAMIRTNRDERSERHDRTAVADFGGRLRLNIDFVEDEDPDTSTRTTRRKVLELLTDEPMNRTHEVLLLPDLGTLDPQPGVAAGLLAGLIGSRVIVAIATPEVLLRPGVPVSNRVLKALMTALGELHVALESRRRSAGLAAAQERGTKVGRPGFVWDAEAYAALQALLDEGKSLRAIGEGGLLTVAMDDGTTSQPSVSAIRRALKARDEEEGPSAAELLKDALSDDDDEDEEDDVRDDDEDEQDSEGTDDDAGSATTEPAPDPQGA